MSTLISIDDVDSFSRVLDVSPDDIKIPVLSTVRSLNEREELEPFIRRILFDANETAHGPAEIVDILTHKMTVKGVRGIAAFVLKGRSFRTVRPRHVSHQIYRLEKISALRFAVLAWTGNILDAAHEEFTSTAKRLGLDYLLLDAHDLARLFIAYGYICPRDGRRVVAGRCNCGYRPRHRVPNVLQTEAERALRRAHRAGERAALVVLPPGAGKTLLAARDAQGQLASTVLYVAHTHEILDVAESEFCSVFGEESVARHSSKITRRNVRRVNLSTIQRLAKTPPSDAARRFDYLVVDEFHHAAAKSYRKLLERVDAGFLLGLTATPFRGDRQDILQLCGGNLIVRFELRTGIESGVLCPYHYYGCFDDIDYSRIHHRGSRYDVRDLERRLAIPERDHAIVGKWQELADGLPTIAFCVTHVHARRVAAAFNRIGIPAVEYVSTTPLEKRRKLRKRLRTGSLKILCTVDVLNEGADFPFVECLLFLRPTESPRIFFQQLGRGLRRHVGKSHCVVIDFIGNFKNAFRIVDYQSLDPDRSGEPSDAIDRLVNKRQLLNLPLGCKVTLDHRLVDLFAEQIGLHPRYASRHNIAKIMLYEYLKLREQLGREPTRTDVNRTLLLGTPDYARVFGSWRKFLQIARGKS